MQCFAELISCNGTSEHHHPHRHFPLKLESISRDIWEMQGRLWQRHFNLQHNLFQMEQPDYLCSAPPFTFRGCSPSLFFKGSLASCFCWKCLLGKKNQALCHLHEHFDTVCKCSLCWRCLSWGGLKSCWTLMGTIWRGSFILWQCAIVDTEQVSETGVIRASSCNQVTHIYSLLKDLCWLRNFYFNFSPSQPPCN